MMCDYCGRRPRGQDRGPLCATCANRPSVRLLYAHRRRHEPAGWQARLAELARRAALRLPLFGDELPPARPDPPKPMR